MTERMERRLLDLKARQNAGEHMLCPRCGADTLKEPVHTNVLSRATDLYVCDACGSVETMLAFMKQEYPLTSWAAFQPVRPPSDLGALLAAEVLQRVLKEQVNTLIHLCLGFIRCSSLRCARFDLEAVAPAPGGVIRGRSARPAGIPAVLPR
mgnify:CR=1 FL=1